MNAQPHTSPQAHDVEIPGACAACGGSLLVRLTPSSARAVCLACHALAPLTVAMTPEGPRLVQEVAAAA